MSWCVRSVVVSGAQVINGCLVGTHIHTHTGLEFAGEVSQNHHMWSLRMVESGGCYRRHIGVSKIRATLLLILAYVGGPPKILSRELFTQVGISVRWWYIISTVQVGRPSPCTLGHISLNSSVLKPRLPYDCRGLPMPPNVTIFVTRYSSTPYLDPSLPKPDSLTPPNGAAGSEINPVLTPTMPTSSASATL